VGPKGFSAPEVELDVRVGGRYRIEMQPLEGNGFFILGEFRQVDPPTRLAYTFPRAARPGVHEAVLAGMSQGGFLSLRAALRGACTSCTGASFWEVVEMSTRTLADSRAARSARPDHEDRTLFAGWGSATAG
jgi:uncharacterized protein YndB with AHSA1/START domain